MDLFKDNKETFDEIIDFYYFIKEYGYIYSGYGEEELQIELKTLRDSITNIRKILDDNYGV